MKLDLCCVLSPIRGCAKCGWHICWTCYRKRQRTDDTTSIYPMHDKDSDHVMKEGAFPAGDILVYPD